MEEKPLRLLSELRSPQHRPAVLCPHVVFRLHVPSQFQPKSYRGRVVLGLLLQRGGVHGSRLREDQVQVDRRRIVRVLYSGVLHSPVRVGES